jgi:hypothetical protein
VIGQLIAVKFTKVEGIAPGYVLSAPYHNARADECMIYPGGTSIEAVVTMAGERHGVLPALVEETPYSLPSHAGPVYICVEIAQHDHRIIHDHAQGFGQPIPTSVFLSHSGVRRDSHAHHLYAIIRQTYVQKIRRHKWVYRRHGDVSEFKPGA